MNYYNIYIMTVSYTHLVLAEKLTIAGLEVEGIEKMAEGTNLVIGQVLTCENHPDSDHLHVTTVNVGDEVLKMCIRDSIIPWIKWVFNVTRPF